MAVTVFLGMLSVGDGVTDDVLQEDLEDSTGLFIDEARDTPRHLCGHGGWRAW